MKAHKIELFIIDFDELGINETVAVLESTTYPNHCIRPVVKATESVDIGEWSDDHPLNKPETCEAEYDRLFPSEGGK